MSFDAQVTQLSENDLDRLFEAAPTGTPTADTLAVGKQQTEEKIVIDGANGIDSIPTFDDSLLADEKDAEEVAEEKPEEKPEKVDKKAPVATEEEVEEEKSEEKEEEEEAVDAGAVTTVLKNTVDYLVNQGLWVDFEGRENLEITEEVYAELAAKQAQHTAYEIVNELIDSTGAYGKAIISHIKNGGNPDEIIDLFKEQKSIDSIDTSTEEGKQAKIEKYYSEVLGWKPQKVEKLVRRLIADGEIETEFADVEEQFNEYYNKKLEAIEEERKAVEFENKRKQEVFVNSIKEALDEDPSLNAREKQIIASSILDFRHNLGNGQKVNDFYVKFAEMQADPKKYIKLVRFVMDGDNYEKQIQVQEKSKAAKEIFSFIKGNQTINKTKNQTIEANENPRKNKKQGTDFSLLVKN